MALTLDLYPHKGSLGCAAKLSRLWQSSVCGGSIAINEMEESKFTRAGTKRLVRVQVDEYGCSTVEGILAVRHEALAADCDCNLLR